MKRSKASWNKEYHEVAERDNNCCVLCGQLANDVHHVVFRSHGGKDEAGNCVCLCRQCHELAHGTNAKMVREKLQEYLRKVRA